MNLLKSIMLLQVIAVSIAQAEVQSAVEAKSLKILPVVSGEWSHGSCHSGSDPSTMNSKMMINCLSQIPNGDMALDKFMRLVESSTFRAQMQSLAVIAEGQTHVAADTIYVYLDVSEYDIGITIVPGSHDKSLLWIRVGRLEQGDVNYQSRVSEELSFVLENSATAFDNSHVNTNN